MPLGVELAGGRLEDPDELPADDLALLLRVGDARPARRGTGRPRRPPCSRMPVARDVVLLDLLGLARPQQPVVDEDAGELVADRPVHQRRGDRRVDPAGQRRRSPARRRPVARIAATCSSMMLAEVQVGSMPAMSCRNRSSIRCPCGVCATSGWNCTPGPPVRRRPRTRPPGARALRAVTVKPVGRHASRSRRGSSRRSARAGSPPSSTPPSPVDGQRGAAELALAGVRHLAAQRLRHRLEAVADAEHRHAGVEQRRVDLGRPRLVHAGRPAGQHDRGRVAGPASRATGIECGTISE